MPCRCWTSSTAPRCGDPEPGGRETCPGTYLKAYAAFGSFRAAPIEGLALRLLTNTYINGYASGSVNRAGIRPDEITTAARPGQ